MERADIMNLISNLRNDIDNADTRGGIIDQISEALNSVCDNVDTLTNANAEYIRNNEQLRNANMKLFMQIGEPAKETKAEEPVDEPKKLTFENLFNEKGELK